MNEAVEIKLRLQDLIQRMPDEIATPLRELSRMLCAVIDHNEKERTRALVSASMRCHTQEDQKDVLAQIVAEELAVFVGQNMRELTGALDDHVERVGPYLIEGFMRQDF